MPHITLIKNKDSISIHVSSLLDHYTTDGGTWFYLLLVPKTRVTAEHAWGVVGGHGVVYGVIRPCRVWFMPHIPHKIVGSHIHVYVSSSLDYYITDEVYGPSSVLRKYG